MITNLNDLFFYTTNLCSLVLNVFVNLDHPTICLIRTLLLQKLKLLILIDLIVVIAARRQCDLGVLRRWSEQLGVILAG